MESQGNAPAVDLGHRTPVDWLEVLRHLTFAFQPIVSAHSGVCYGYEALLRGWDDAGFGSIHEVFDEAYRCQQLHALDLSLRHMALELFVKVPFHRHCRLFYNIDGRVLEMPDYKPGWTREVMAGMGLAPERLVFEISERHDASASEHLQEILHRYRLQRFGIALDDFGSGYSGLQLLYHSEPKFIKIDRFFIEGIATDPRKKLFVSNVVNVAHVLGIAVIGEGIETEEELRVCREIGCEFVQGYFVQRPTVDIGALRERYESVAQSARGERRMRATASTWFVERLERPAVVSATCQMSEVLELFRNRDDAALVVVLDVDGCPLGIIRERSMKRFIYSQFGWALLAARHSEPAEHLTRCPVAEIHTPVERVMDMFSTARDAEEGVILTEDGRYVGFLTTASLLKAVNERNIELARDQNPLTRLPGNTIIREFTVGAVSDACGGHIFAYLDFDDFKPFNDCYGFRMGDRAIQLFADSLRGMASEHGLFVGHIGGDDFFVGGSIGDDGHAAIDLVLEIVAKFRNDVQSLYSPQDRARGGIVVPDRNGELVQFGMLDISVAALILPPGIPKPDADTVGSVLAQLKKSAKRTPNGLATLAWSAPGEA